MKNLLILGAGQYGIVAKETAQLMGCFEKISFLDDNSLLAVGKLHDYRKFALEYSHAFVAIGNPVIRESWITQLSDAGFSLAVLIHPQAAVMPSAEIAGASIIEAQAVVNSGAKLEKGSLICAGSVVNHNSVVRTCCQIDCNAVIPANAVVPPHTKVPCGESYKVI